jgi:hypothetical protein
MGELRKRRNFGGTNNMKCVMAVLALLAVALPMAAWADGITLVNEYGTIAISDMAGTGGLGTIGASTISSAGSELMAFNGLLAPKGHSLGTVSYSTGVLLSGSVAAGGVFSATGSTFDVDGAGMYGQPKGVIFTGSFSGPVDWTLISKVGPESTYALTGDISGMLYTGRMVSGTTTQDISILNGQQLNQGIGHASLGSTQLSAPEPQTLSLFGTGLVAMAGVFRRKLFGS